MDEQGLRGLYASAAVREIEQRAFAQGLDPFSLMQQAAAAAWRAARRRWPQAPQWCVVCGTGHNGGDGYVFAALAAAEGQAVQLFEIDGGARSPLARQARQLAIQAGLSVQAWTREALARGARAVWVDAIYGIGLNRAVSGEAAAAIATLQRDEPRLAGVLALDLPSGLDADRGCAWGPDGLTVRADLTVSFVRRKPGAYTGRGPEACGERQLEALGLPLPPGLQPLAWLLDAGDLRGWLPRRSRQAHKGDHGEVQVVGGDQGMGGAALLCGRAALRAGAGWVRVWTRPVHVPALLAAQPELMGEDAAGFAAGAPGGRHRVLALGPGLGRGDWGASLQARALAAPFALRVLDADALTHLAEAPQRLDAAVLTPHPGEAARLLGQPVPALEADRLAAARALSSRYGAVVVLKGAGTVIDTGTRTWICPYGNPGMAVGGSGDVLTGVIAALAAQGLPAEPAAAAGVLAHALAGDAAAAQRGERGLLPSDLIEALPAVVNPCG